jgi:hypothetical protein
LWIIRFNICAAEKSVYLLINRKQYYIYPNRAFCKVHKKFNYCTILKSTYQSIEAVLNKNTPYQVQNTNVNKSNWHIIPNCWEKMEKKNEKC